MACGLLLTRAHARKWETALIAGSCGNSPVFGEALADWVDAFGDQTESYHAAVVPAIKAVASQELL